MASSASPFFNGYGSSQRRLDASYPGDGTLVTAALAGVIALMRLAFDTSV